MSDTGAVRWRTIFISDVHLGARTAQAQQLVDFLRVNDADTIYIVGDFVDFWRLRKHSHWPQQHNDVIQKLMRKARKGTRVILIPGNHDEALDQFWGAQFGNIAVFESAVHKTADGRKLLVIHGDEHDGVVRYARSLMGLGDLSYAASVWANGALNMVRRAIGLPHWSLAAYIKTHLKQAVSFIDRFERSVSEEAGRRGFDGVVCGHVHHAAERWIDGVHYLNCGDWVESCTAIAEDEAGRFHILRTRHEAAVIAFKPRKSEAVAA